MRTSATQASETLCKQILKMEKNLGLSVWIYGEGIREKKNKNPDGVNPIEE